MTSRRKQSWWWVLAMVACGLAVWLLDLVPGPGPAPWQAPAAETRHRPAAGEDRAARLQLQAVVVPGSALRNARGGSSSAGELDVQVLREGGGAVDRAVVRVVPRSTNDGARQGVTGGAGMVRFEQVPAGRYVVSTLSDAEEQPVELMPGSVRVVQLTVREGLRVAGRVVSPDGTGISGASVWVGFPSPADCAVVATSGAP